MDYTKYSRTHHAPWSEALTDDDIRAAGVPFNEGEPVVITAKLDGENTSFYSEGHCHARSLDSVRHPSRSWVRQLAASVAPNMPEGLRVCGENLYARHSIAYTALPTYFMVFGMYETVGGVDTCLDWATTEAYADMLGLQTVPVLYRGPWISNIHSKVWPYAPLFGASRNEGYVIRREGAFPKDAFAENCLKFVVKGHVQTDTHWMLQDVVPNTLSVVA